jgi:hypothetical protein
MIKTYPQADTCRTHARKCLAKAKLTLDNKWRAEFLELAQCWETMAKDIEQLELLRKELKTDAEDVNGGSVEALDAARLGETRATSISQAA